ncbi:MAG: FkbM family methyltransferase [Crocinitomicaceae bacterium]
MSTIHKIIQSLLKAPKFIGRDFLIEQLPKWFIKPVEGKVILKTRYGFKIQLDPGFDKNIENVIFKRGVYEQGTVSALQSFLKEGDTFVDAGANIGFLSLVAAEKVGKFGAVHAFEPFPSTYEILEKNKNINNYVQIRAYPFALGNETGSKTIYTENENRGGASLVNHVSDSGTKIEIRKLDDVKIHTLIKVIKIDVEGYEFEVLKGAEKTIRENKPKLIIEYSVDRNNTIASKEMYAWLKTLPNYKIYKLKYGKERESELMEILSEADLPAHDNIFCSPYYW